MYSHEGKVALVTGAARGLGEGIARALAADGASVVCADIADASPVAERLNRQYPDRRAGAVHIDVTDRAMVARVLAQVVASYGRLDIVVNDAGIAQIGPLATTLADMDPAHADRMIDVNLRGTIHVNAEAVRYLPKGSGRIINLASQWGRAAHPNFAVYSATKAGVVGLTQSLALELAADGITVNCICPGRMRTPLVEEAYRKRAVAAGRPESDADSMIAETAAGIIPLRRMGTAEDVGAMVSWIASEAAGFTTGAAFNVTGGETLF